MNIDEFIIKVQVNKAKLSRIKSYLQQKLKNEDFLISELRSIEGFLAYLEKELKTISKESEVGSRKTQYPSDYDEMVGSPHSQEKSFEGWKVGDWGMSKPCEDWKMSARWNDEIEPLAESRNMRSDICQTIYIFPLTGSKGDWGMKFSLNLAYLLDQMGNEYDETLEDLNVDLEKVIDLIKKGKINFEIKTTVLGEYLIIDVPDKLIKKGD